MPEIVTQDAEKVNTISKPYTNRSFSRKKEDRYERVLSPKGNGIGSIRSTKQPVFQFEPIGFPKDRTGEQ